RSRTTHRLARPARAVWEPRGYRAARRRTRALRPRDPAASPAAHVRFPGSPTLHHLGNARLCALIRGSKSSANRGVTHRTTATCQFCGIDRVLPGQEQLEVRKIVVTPEELVAYLHRWDSEHTTGDRLIGLSAELRLDLRQLGLRHQGVPR